MISQCGLKGERRGGRRGGGAQSGFHPPQLCRALDVTPGDLLELMDDPPKKKAKGKSKKRKKAAK